MSQTVLDEDIGVTVDDTLQYLNDTALADCYAGIEGYDGSELSYLFNDDDD
jgi:hypothetical protein